MKQKILWCLGLAPYIYMLGTIAGVEWIYRLLIFYGSFLILTSCYVWWKEQLYEERIEMKRREKQNEQ